MPSSLENTSPSAWSHTSASPAAASEFAGWVPAGKLRLTRSEPVATRLGDGRVLLTGGQAPVPIVAATELYDPAANAWTPAAPMTDARLWATAVTLADGRALVAGGVQDEEIRPLFTGEIFDPRTGTWSPTGRLNANHVRGAAVVLKDGRVLLVGASGDPDDGLLGFSPELAAEIYDPATNRWTLTGPMSVARVSAAVALLHDGRVLAVGGSSDGIQAGAEIYDPASNAWTAVAPMSRARADAGATTLPDGRVLVAGGDSLYLDGTVGWEPLTTAEIFDPAAGTWSPTGGMSEQRGGDAAMATLADGRCIFVGGSTFDRPVPIGVGSWVINSRPNTAAEVFDAASGTWSASAPSLYPHSDHVAVGLLDGSLLVAGGYGGETERLLPGPTATPSPEPTATPEPEPEPSTPQDPPPLVVPPPHRADAGGRLELSGVRRRLKSSRTGVITITLRCGGSDACRDQLAVKHRRATLLRRDVAVAAGGTATLRLRLPAATRRALRTRAVPLTLELKAAKARSSVTVRR